MTIAIYCRLVARKCKGNGAGGQGFRLTWRKDVRYRSASGSCWDVSEGGERAKVTRFACHGAGGNQYWKYDLVRPKKLTTLTSNNSLRTCNLFKLIFSQQVSKTLKHGGNSRCLDMDQNEEVFVSSCNGQRESQKWKWEKADERRLGRWDDDPWP